VNPNGLGQVLVRDLFPCKFLQGLPEGVELRIEKLERGFLHHRRNIEKVEVGEVEGVSPDTVAPYHAVAAVGHHHSGEEVVSSLDGEVKAAPDKRADNRLQQGVALGDRLVYVAPHPEGHTACSRDHLQRNKGTHVPDQLPALFVQFLCPEPVIVIQRFHFRHCLFLFAHGLSPFAA
jgi:hypothetical protein